MDVKLYFIDETNLDQQSKHVVGKINKIATKNIFLRLHSILHNTNHEYDQLIDWGFSPYRQYISHLTAVKMIKAFINNNIIQIHKHLKHYIFFRQ